MKANPKNKEELLENLKAISDSPMCKETEHNFALALAYIVFELVPDDRTTKHVFRSRGAT